LLIDDRPPEEPMSGLLGFPGTYPVGCCMPDESLHDHSHLASELFALFIFQTGRPFEDRHAAAAKQDWSQVMWDLLEAGMKKVFNRKNSGRHRIPRAGGGPLQMMDGSSFSRASSQLSWNTAAEIVGRDGARCIYGQDNDIPPHDFQGGGDGEEPEGGVSVVLIETSERESEG